MDVRLKRAYEAQAAADGYRVLEAKLRELRGRARRAALTLVYGARDEEHKHAVVLAELLRRGKAS